MDCFGSKAKDSSIYPSIMSWVSGTTVVVVRFDYYSWTKEASSIGALNTCSSSKVELQ